MSNPFDQGGWDPFGELTAGNKPATPDLSSRTSDRAAPSSIKPARAAPAPPRQAADPFSAGSDDDPFGLLSATHVSSSSSASTNNTWTAVAPAAPPSYESLVPQASAASQSREPPPPSYGAALDLPPPPAYDAASFMPSAPPNYDAAVGAAQHTQQQQPVVIMPARPAPPDPSARGPLHAGMPSRPAPAAPVPVRAAPPAPVPARPAPAAPAAPARAAPPAPVPAGAAPPGPAAAAAAGSTGVSSSDLDWLSQASAAGSAAAAASSSPPLNQQLAGLHVSARAATSGNSSSSLSSSYASMGNVGAVPKSGMYNSQQAMQRELNAQIRLPPLNPKTAAPLKVLAAGLGSLFAGPVGDASQILQWTPSDSGTTLPLGGRASSREDHDSAACAELAPRMQDAEGFSAAASSSSKSSRVTCMVMAPGAGWLWCGTTDGHVHCWVLGQGGASGTAKWLHSWLAHSGKVKGMAASPTGRLFTGSSNGAVKMWGYGSRAFADPAAPRLLRQLRKLDARTGVSLNPHSKVIGLVVSAGGRVLWTVGKHIICLWSTHNGECLGTLSDGSDQPDMMAVGPSDINPKTGLGPARLDRLFQQPAAELLAENDDPPDGEKDAATIALNAAVKGMGKASKLLGKLGNKLAAKIMDDGRQGSGDTHSTYAASGSSGSTAFGGSALSSTDAGMAYKVQRWGAIKKAVAAVDGSIWLSYKKGMVERYSEGGQLLWSSSAGGTGAFKPSDITALAAVGSSVWVGDKEGQVWVLDGSSSALQRSWRAHVFPVRSIASGGHLVYTLGKDGSIRAWGALPPPPALTAAWQQDLTGCLQQQQLQVLVGTWNVNETKPSRPGLQMWLSCRAKTAHLIMIGLQEVEMGTGSVALDVVYQNLAKGRLEAGTSAAQAWAAAVGEVLCSQGAFTRVGLRQMSGILVLVFARAELEPHIGEVATASVACGVMGYGGNKGAVAISFSLFRRRVVIVSSHFAAHQEKVEARNADYAKIVRHLHFHNVPTDKPQQQQQYESSDVVVVAASGEQTSSIHSFLARQNCQQQQHEYGELGSTGGSGSPRNSPRPPLRGAGARGYHGSSSSSLGGAGGAGAAAGGAGAGGAGGDAGGGAGGAAGVMSEEDWGAGVRDAELLVWVGDFNYRVDCPEGFVADTSDPEKWPVSDQLFHFVHKKIAARQHMDLLSGDQCIRGMARGAIFHGLAEGPISFMPTYKFEKGRESNAMQPFYDQGEKKRVPAWTDRVFFRGSAPQRSALQANATEQAADVRVSLANAQSYNSLMEVNDSDHKPVYAVLNLQLPWYQQQQQRCCSLSRLWQVASSSSSSGLGAEGAAGGALSLLVEPQQLLLQGSYAAANVRMSNPSRTGSCLFMVQGSGPGGALPTWLEVVPSVGVIAPGGSARLSVQGTKAQWLAGGSCELRIVGSLQGSVDSSTWPMGPSYGLGQPLSVVLP